FIADFDGMTARRPDPTLFRQDNRDRFALDKGLADFGSVSGWSFSKNGATRAQRMGRNAIGLEQGIGLFQRLDLFCYLAPLPLVGCQQGLKPALFFGEILMFLP